MFISCLDEDNTAHSLIRAIVTKQKWDFSDLSSKDLCGNGHLNLNSKLVVPVYNKEFPVQAI
eukprot:4986297-Ditylum_brightwellii.AAC.1